MLANQRRDPSRPVTTIAIAAALLLALSSMAAADTVYNDVLEGTETEPSIDATIEVLAVTAGAASTSVTLRLTTVDATDGHASCNVEGNGNNKIVLNIVNSNTGVATVVGPDVVNPTLVTFEDCLPDAGATQLLTVTGVSVGTAQITFTINEAASSNSALNSPRSYTLNAASFNVNVAAGDGGDDDTYCEDPAAPAWAAHILKFSGVKPKKGKPQPADNYVAQVAQHMGPGTTFDTVTKVTHPEYEQAVMTYLSGLGLTNLSLPSTWPALQCTSVT